MSLRFETPRLILRSFEESDIKGFSAYRSDPEVARYQGWETPFSIAQAAFFIDHMLNANPGEPGQWYQLAIALKENTTLIGDCAFQRLFVDHNQAEIGFTLARVYQGQGYAAEAVTRLLAYLFDDLHMHRVIANCDPANQPSFKLMERLGMRHEGRFVESLWFHETYVSEDWFAILEREWQARNNRQD